MDKGTWIAIVVLIIAAGGFFLLQILPSTPPSDSSGPATQTQTIQQTQSQPSAPQIATDQQSCQGVAQVAAQQTGATFVGANFSAQGVCYYELDTFVSNGNMTSINEAPNNTELASCTTNASGSLSCVEQGVSITEPQFKALLTTYLGN